MRDFHIKFTNGDDLDVTYVKRVDTFKANDGSIWMKVLTLDTNTRSYVIMLDTVAYYTSTESK